MRSFTLILSFILLQNVFGTCSADDVDEIGKEELQHLIHNSQLWDILSQDNKVTPR
jgi:hypothetical protein